MEPFIFPHSSKGFYKGDFILSDKVRVFFIRITRKFFRTFRFPLKFSPFLFLTFFFLSSLWYEVNFWGKFFRSLRLKFFCSIKMIDGHQSRWGKRNGKTTFPKLIWEGKSRPLHLGEDSALASFRALTDFRKLSKEGPFKGFIPYQRSLPSFRPDRQGRAVERNRAFSTTKFIEELPWIN